MFMLLNLGLKNMLNHVIIWQIQEGDHNHITKRSNYIQTLFSPKSLLCKLWKEWEVEQLYDHSVYRNKNMFNL